MILHFVTDEKFICMAHREFEAVAPRRNRFIIMSEPRALRYIRNIPIEFFPKKECRRLLKEEKYDAVCLHTLKAGYDALPAIKPGKKVFWFGWGFDYYDGPLAAPDSNRHLLLPKTQELTKTAVVRGNAWPLSMARGWASKVLWQYGRFSRSSLSRIDYFSPVLDCEYDIVRANNPWFTAKYLPWNYGTVEDDFLIGGTVVRSKGSDILLGNSASSSNNHLEAFDWLAKRQDLGARRIIVPLSYGNVRYRDAILAAGREILGERFLALIEFMPISEYVETLSRCGFVFMNHLRQQAVGTVLIMLMAGAKIYLQPKNPLYNWLCRRGAVVFDIGLLQHHGTDGGPLFEPLLDHQKLKNMEVALGNWGREVQRVKTRRLVDLIYTGEQAYEVGNI